MIRMANGNHSYIVRYNMNGMVMYAAAEGADGASEPSATRFENRRDAEKAAADLAASGHRKVTIVKVGLRRRQAC